MVKQIQSTSDPAVTDDSAKLFLRIGDRWLNTVSGDLFECANPAPGAASWLKIYDGSLSDTELGFVDGVTAGTLTASKALVVDANKLINEFRFAPQTVTPDALASSGTNTIPEGANSVIIAAPANGANDWFYLPALASTPNGHRITIMGNFACEMRVPEAANSKINDVECSNNVAEHVVTLDSVLTVVKRSTTAGWATIGLTKLGAVIAAVIPD